MPVHGTEATVLRAVRSVLAQTDPDFELIVIDDASPDDAHRVLADHLAAHPDPRVRCLRNERNRGLAASRNRGLDEARGAWLAFLDSDDAYRPEFLATMHEHSPGVDVVAAAHDVVHPDGTRRRRERGPAGTYGGAEAQLMGLRDELTPYAWDKIFRSETVGDLRFPVVDRVEDAGFCIPLLGRARLVRVIPDSLHLYSMNPRSITWGSVPPIPDSYRFLAHLKAATGAHEGTEGQRDAFAVTWSLVFLNSAQSALRLRPDDLRGHLQACREALRLPILRRCLRVRPLFGAAGLLLKLSPALYIRLYGAYVRRAYGL